MPFVGPRENLPQNVRMYEIIVRCKLYAYYMSFCIYSFGATSIRVFCKQKCNGHNQCDGNGVPILVTRLIKYLFEKAKYDEGSFWLHDRELSTSSMESYRLFVKEFESKTDANQMKFHFAFYSTDIIWVAFVNFFLHLRRKPFPLAVSDALRGLSKYLNSS